MIPIDDVPWALAELGRVARKGLRGAMIATNPPEGARPYRDGSYDPFWAAAEEAGMPITLHIVTGRVRDPFTYHGEEERGEVPRSFIELFHEALPVLAGDFIFGGIFDRFPRLKLVVAEYEASWIPHFRFRLDRIERFPGLRTLEKPARDYLRENIYVGIINDPLAAAMRNEIRGGTLIDGTGGPPLADATVQVAGGVIQAVRRGPDRPAAGAVEVLDARGKTVLPGLIDAHCHLSYGEGRSAEEIDVYGGAEWSAVRAVYNARKVLRAGVTGV